MFLKTFLRKCFRKEKKKPEEIFIDACKRGDLGLVRECLRQGVDVNSGGCAGLEEAIIGLNTEVASLLLAQPNIELTERHLELALTRSKEVTLKIVSKYIPRISQSQTEYLAGNSTPQSCQSQPDRDS